MDIKELTQRNADALKKAIGEKLTCPMCHHKDFIVVGGYIRNDIQTQMDGWVMGSAAASLVCPLQRVVMSALAETMLRMSNYGFIR